jgi:hypothetical protein
MPPPDVNATEEQRIYERIDKDEISISQGFAPMINVMTDLELIRGARNHDARLGKRRLDARRSGLVARDTKLLESDLPRLAPAQKLLREPVTARDACGMMAAALRSRNQKGRILGQIANRQGKFKESERALLNAAGLPKST